MTITLTAYDVLDLEKKRVFDIDPQRIIRFEAEDGRGFDISWNFTHDCLQILGVRSRGVDALVLRPEVSNKILITSE